MTLLANLAARLRSVFRPGREDAETREELRFHLEVETEKNLRAGMDPREARRRAHARLGGVEAIREAVRDARGMRPAEDLLRDLGYALRGARRNPGFTLAAVVSLAVPIGFNTTIFAIVDSLLFRPLPVVRPAELVDVYTSDPEGDWYSTSSYQDYLDLRAENGVFTDMAAHVPMSAVVGVDDAASLVMGEAVTGNYFQLLGVQPVLGRMLTPEDDRPGAARGAVIPGVQAASRTSDVPLDASGQPENVLVSGLHGPADRGARVDTAVVSTGYFDTLGVALVQGRNFTTADTRESPRVAVVSEAMALRFWPAGTAVGRRLRLGEWDGPEYEIVGVSADYEVRPGTEEPASYLHLAASQHIRPFVALLARTDGDASSLSAVIRRELRRMEPDILFNLSENTLRETAAAAMLPNRIAATVASAAGLVALVLGAIGLYGVVAYLVLRRTREFAIRSALGAGSGTLLRLVLATGAGVAAVGASVGAVLAFAVTGLASRAAPGISVADPVVWAGVLLLVVGVTAAAHVGPARRILRLDLARALHVE